MTFLQRAFTMPGTGGREAQQMIAAHDAAAAAEASTKTAVPPPSPETVPKVEAPKAPPQFSPNLAPGAKQKARITGMTMLGAAAGSSEVAKASLGKGSGKTVLG